MTRRPRMPDELVELFEEKKEHRNQNIGDILLDEFPSLAEELEKREKNKPDIDDIF